jgi:hypothetical protein
MIRRLMLIVISYFVVGLRICLNLNEKQSFQFYFIFKYFLKKFCLKVCFSRCKILKQIFFKIFLLNMSIFYLVQIFK